MFQKKECDIDPNSPEQEREKKSTSDIAIWWKKTWFVYSSLQGHFEYQIKKILLFTKKHSTSTWKCRKKSFTLVKKFNSKIGDKHYLNEKFFFLSNSKWTGIKWYFYIDNVTLRREKKTP